MSNGQEIPDESHQWQATLEDQLMRETRNEIAIPYEQVAKAFPSNHPHPDTFEYSLINDREFIPWARERGWTVSVSENQILFRRIPE